MLNFLAHHIIRKRPYFIAIILVITAFMAYHASKIELSYDFVRPLPVDDPEMINYDKFKKIFGQDGSVLIIGIQDSTFYQLNKFNDWYDLTNDIKKISGIKDVLSVANLYTVLKNDSLQKFDFKPIMKSKPQTQLELDSIHKTIDALPFYKGLVINPDSNVTLMLVTFEKKDLNSNSRIDIVNTIESRTKQFAEKHHLQPHFSGMPYIRTQYMKKVSHEMVLFLILSVLITAIIVFFIFKSTKIILYSLAVVVVGIIWSLGTIALMGYKITILTGLIPSLITVIGLPNCVFIINKYLNELVAHGNKIRAVYHSITKVALSNFLANVTTSIGFGVFYFTNSNLLVEFGVVAAINVMATYSVALVLIPIILSFAPKPKARNIVHLTGKRINWTVNKIDYLVHNQRIAIYITMLIITVISLYGMNKINLIGFVVDDLPKRDPIYTDLRFFERNFNGVLPFEITVDTKDTNGIFKNGATALYKINYLQKVVGKYDEFSKPVSIVEALKFAYQSFKGGKKKYYILPEFNELNRLKNYTQTVKGQENKFANFVDSTKQITRVSFQMADVGSARMKVLIKELQPKIDSIFPKTGYNVSMTGNSLVFLKGNDYLYHHLFISLAIAIGLILLLGMVLFRSIFIIVLSKLPCLIPLAITAGIMGFFNIPLKPSTILIFSIAFGLSSDGTIYILTEYWNQLRNKNTPKEKAISNTINEVAISMIYTAIILFSGFAIFAASSFGGTVSLGILMSVTIAMALFTNLLMLPAILLSLQEKKL